MSPREQQRSRPEERRELAKRLRLAKKAERDARRARLRRYSDMRPA